MDHDTLLVVGEICVDFTLGTDRTPVKMRLGGIVHAARGLWASGIRYAVAAVCPEYLAKQAETYLRAHGCCHFILIANVVGAPNVFVIRDVREVGHQGYENLLRESKQVITHDAEDALKHYKIVVIFPGSFDLDNVLGIINSNATVTIDVAYDIKTLDRLMKLPACVSQIVISTSSELFMSIATNDIAELLSACRSTGAKHLLLKENRGGSRLFDLNDNKVDEIPAVLCGTVNSVGVGDAFTAVFAARCNAGPLEAAWRGMQVATKYAQTTYMDDLLRDVQRELKLEVREVMGLGGVILPWHERPFFHIYLAAPDFSYIQKPEIDAAISALRYHNFNVRRPVVENGEAPVGTAPRDLEHFYENDITLLRQCSLLFAVPLGRDPGTLVEVGIAIAMGKPVVTFDPRAENNNTMVICGSNSYSDDLEACLNSVFQCLSNLRNSRK